MAIVRDLEYGSAEFVGFSFKPKRSNSLMPLSATVNISNSDGFSTSIPTSGIVVTPSGVVSTTGYTIETIWDTTGLEPGMYNFCWFYDWGLERKGYHQTYRLLDRC